MKKLIVEFLILISILAACAKSNTSSSDAVSAIIETESVSEDV